MLRIPLGDVSLSGWLADLLQVGVQESRAERPGSQSLLAKLSELASPKPCAAMRNPIRPS
ncbi:MAG: hypothetical protein ACXWVQ_09720 [Methyloceanibacter sp.]